MKSRETCSHRGIGVRLCMALNARLQISTVYPFFVYGPLGSFPFGAITTKVLL